MINTEYSIAIRTLGKAGIKYQQMLDSIKQLTIQPQKIIVYIAEGYEIPKETINKEIYVYTRKGMVAQRAIQFKEIETEYCLFLDDDVYLAPDSIEKMFQALEKYKADVISPALFLHKFSFLQFVVLNVVPHNDKNYAYKILPSGGFSYNEMKNRDVCFSESNSGPCFLCKKNTMLSINLNNELWLDETGYALWDDQTMFYKMYLSGYKILTIFNSGIVHLDASSSKLGVDIIEKIVYADSRNRLIFWYKFIYKQKKGFLSKTKVIIALYYSYIMQLLLFSASSVKHLSLNRTKAFIKGIKDAIIYINKIK